MYVSSADLLSIHYTIIQHGGWLHRGPQKTTRLSKLGGGCLLGDGHLLGDGRLPGTIRYIPFSASCSV